MAPKVAKKPKGEKKLKVQAPQIDQDGISAEEMMEKLKILEKEKNKEEEYRNYMQLERDKINSFWEITKRDYEDKKTELRNKDREMEDMEERHQVEIKVYKQKVKHLLYEHENSIATIKADGEVEFKLQSDENQKSQIQLDRDKWSLKQELRETELGQQEFTRQLNLDHAKETTKLRQDFELQENRKLSNPLQKAFKEVDQLQQQLQMQEKEKQNLYQVKGRLTATEKQIQSEKDGILSNFESAIYDQQQKSSLKIISLDKRIEALCNQLEKKETQLAEILTIVPIDQNYNQLNAQNMGKKIDEVIENKNQIIKALQFDIAKVSKAHNDLIKVYEAKLQEYGIPIDELGFRPLLTKITSGPALIITG